MTRSAFRFSGLLPVAILALGFAVVAPSLWSGWTGDDAFYSALRGMLRIEHESLWQAMRHAFLLWFHANGRFYPLHILETYLVFYVFTNLVAYKAFLIAMTLVTIELFRRCVAGYAGRNFGNLCALAVVPLLAERGYHDSILAYNAMPQVVAILMLASFASFRAALAPGGRLALPAALYALAALTYEDAYALCLLYPVVALAAGKPARAAIRIAAPFVAVAAALTAFSLWMRHLAHVPAGSLYASSLEPAAVVRTAAYQISSAFPLSYWIFDPSRIFSRSNVADFLRNTPVSPVTLVAAAAVAAAALRPRIGEKVRTGGAAAVGAALMVLPALPIAVALKYQRELALGLGYLPVFFQAFGTALLGGAGIVAALRRFRSPAVRTALVVLIACCITVTQAANVRLVREGAASRAARAALERQLSAGLVASVRDGSAIAVAPGFDWIDYDDDGPDGISTRGMFASYANRVIRLVPPSDPAATALLRYDAEGRRWVLVPRR